MEHKFQQCSRTSRQTLNDGITHVVKHFCVLPWFGREVIYSKGETHCCLLPKNYDIDEIRRTMQQGGRPRACQKCWTLEDQGIKSDRQVKNETLDFYLDRDIDLIKLDAEKNGERVLMLKLATSYTCNATCIICSPLASSSWNQLAQKITPAIPIEKYNPVDTDKIKNKIDFKNLVSLTLIGGEPLLEKKNLEILDYILSLGNDRLFLSIVTNGSVLLNSAWRRTLAKFRNLNFSVSIDGTGQVFEYTRYPLLWKDLNGNLDFFRTITDNISSNYTVSNCNVLYHNDTVEWFLAEKINFSINPIYNPAHFSPGALPAAVKQKIKKQIEILDPIYHVPLDHSALDESNYKIFREELKKQDQAKGIHIKNYLPDLCHLLDLDH